MELYSGLTAAGLLFWVLLTFPFPDLVASWVLSFLSVAVTPCEPTDCVTVLLEPPVIPWVPVLIAPWFVDPPEMPLPLLDEEPVGEVEEPPVHFVERLLALSLRP